MVSVCDCVLCSLVLVLVTELFEALALGCTLSAEMNGNYKYDDTFMNILREEGQILTFLDAIFGFLHRRLVIILSLWAYLHSTYLPWLDSRANRLGCMILNMSIIGFD